MTTFQHLPTEVRLNVWAQMIEPRRIPIRLKSRRESEGGEEKIVTHYMTSASVPVVLQVCRESRDHAQEFMSRFCYHGLCLAEELDEDPYIWVCFDLDIVDIADLYFCHFANSGHLIRRLQFKADNSEEWWYRHEAREVKIFTQMVQCFVNAIDGWEGWVESYTEHGYDCEADGLWIIDPDRSKMMSFPEIDTWYDIEDKYEREDEFGIDPGLALTILK